MRIYFKFLPLIFLLTNCYSNICDVFENLDQQIVIETKRIEFEDFPGAFNPSILKIDQGFLLTFRYCPDLANQSWLSYIGIVELDTALNPRAPPELLTTRLKRSKTPSQTEDARLFLFGDTIFLIYNDNVDEMSFDHCNRRDMFLAELRLINGKYQLFSPLKLTHEEKYFSVLQQKNWIPFEYQNSLFFSYSIHPHEVLKPNLESGLCSRRYQTEPKLNWNYGSLRGSSAAQLVDGSYLAFFHSSVYIRSSISPHFRAWHYFMGAYTFSATPPFELTQISEKPIFCNNFYSSTSSDKKVVFPGGFAVEGSHIYVAYGKDDREIWIATLDKEALQQSLIKIRER